MTEEYSDPADEAEFAEAFLLQCKFSDLEREIERNDALEARTPSEDLLKRTRAAELAKDLAAFWSGDAKVMPKLRAQEKAILDCLRSMGYDPKKLPKASNGKWDGVKAECKRKLMDSPLFRGKSTVFDKAWDRMLHYDIEYA